MIGGYQLPRLREVFVAHHGILFVVELPARTRHV